MFDGLFVCMCVICPSHKLPFLPKAKETLELHFDNNRTKSEEENVFFFHYENHFCCENLSFGLENIISCWVVELIFCLHFKRLAHNVNLALSVHLVHSIHLAYSVIKIQAVGAEKYHSRENLAKC